MRLTISYVSSEKDRPNQVEYQNITQEEVVRYLNHMSAILNLRVPGETVIITIQENEDGRDSASD